ncbi:MAG: Eco57I restriction-modification methylase domain-containing protein [Gemmatimonadaceae bacterium]
MHARAYAPGVPTIHAAAALLRNAATLDDLSQICAVLRFADPPLDVHDEVRDSLGLTQLVLCSRIVQGGGTLRALLAECERGTIRESTRAIAQRLASRAPELLWILILTERAGNATAIASCSGEGRRPRVSALVVQRDALVQSDAETLCALAAVSEAEDILTHARWMEVLGRDALTRRFFTTLERITASLAERALGADRSSQSLKHEIALLYISRLLFLSFLEQKGWMNGDRRFLENTFTKCMISSGGFHRKVLLPLFFGTLNTAVRRRSARASAFGRIPFLNGGLFSRSVAEKRCGRLVFPDEELGNVFGDLLVRYRFTAREDTSSWSEAAIDPEMLGKAFESLMASRERRSSGSFYTPQALVETATRTALIEALAEGGGGISSSVVERVLGGEIPDDITASRLLSRIHALRVLDPACGSGAFLVHALEELATLATRLGDPRHPSDLRRWLLTRSIFGVDINPTAVWLCELRLWLCVVIDSDAVDPIAVDPLPNLDRHIRVGDALAGTAFGDHLNAGGARMARLRDRYTRATGSRKATLSRALDREERTLSISQLERETLSCDAKRRDLLSAVRSRDLFGERQTPTALERQLLVELRARSRELRAATTRLDRGAALPFSFPTHFPDAAARGGFDIVIANPPWVRLHRIPRATRSNLRTRFEVFLNAGWDQGTGSAHAGSGFAAQVDLSALFLERAVSLLRPGGVTSLLLPAKLWRSLAGGGARRLVRHRTTPIALEDWSEAPSQFDAAVYPSLLVARRREPAVASESRSLFLVRSTQAESRPIAAALHRRTGALRWEIAQERLSLDEDPRSPWLALPSEVRDSFDRLRRAGPPLAESVLGSPLLGVKCGCNEAFAVSASWSDGHVAHVRSGALSGSVERSMLRPLVRGENVRAWSIRDDHEFILWPHGADLQPLDHLPPYTERWLAPWRRRLSQRSDARRKERWWMLFRTGSADVSQPRVIWADFGRVPRACVLQAGDQRVPLNSCYALVAPSDADANAFCALLNSPICAAWLNALAEPARGGYKRYLAWTVALLPIPRDWARAVQILAPLGERGMRAGALSEAELIAGVSRAYRVRSGDLSPLIAWSAR